MGDRFFPNEMPYYIPETQSAAAAADSLTRLLHLPLDTLSERLKRDALDVKDKVAPNSIRFNSIQFPFFRVSLNVCSYNFLEISDF